MPQKFRCIFKPQLKTTWEHIRNCQGTAIIHIFDTVYRTEHIYVFTPDRDKFGSKDCRHSYIVNIRELEFLDESN